MPTIPILNDSAAVIVDRAWPVAWQWTVLVLLVAAPAQWLLRSQSPGLRYWVWQIVLVKLLLMPLWTYALPARFVPAPLQPALSIAPVEPDIERDMQPTGRPAASNQEPQVDKPTEADLPATAIPDQRDLRPAALSWQAWTVITWAAVIGLQLLRLMRQRGRLARLLRAARPADGLLTAAVDETAALLQLKPPRVVTTSANVSPFVCGLGRPVLVLPESLSTSLTSSQRQQVLLHELAHLRRRDLVWGWIPELVRIVWWFHPVVHWVVHRLRLERELACDQWAMTLSGHDASEYAATLVEVVRHTSQPDPSVERPLVRSKN